MGKPKQLVELENRDQWSSVLLPSQCVLNKAYGDPPSSHPGDAEALAGVQVAEDVPPDVGGETADGGDLRISRRI